VDDWDHLHVDKGANPQFKLLKQKKWLLANILGRNV
jgi:hypothetical protein